MTSTSPTSKPDPNPYAIWELPSASRTKCKQGWLNPLWASACLFSLLCLLPAPSPMPPQARARRKSQTSTLQDFVCTMPCATRITQLSLRETAARSPQPAPSLRTSGCGLPLLPLQCPPCSPSILLSPCRWLLLHHVASNGPFNPNVL